MYKVNVHVLLESYVVPHEQRELHRTISLPFVPVANMRLTFDGGITLKLERVEYDVSNEEFDCFSIVETDEFQDTLELYHKKGW